jgi:hypothetical protein
MKSIIATLLVAVVFAGCATPEEGAPGQEEKSSREPTGETQQAVCPGLPYTTTPDATNTTLFSGSYADAHFSSTSTSSTYPHGDPLCDDTYRVRVSNGTTLSSVITLGDLNYGYAQWADTPLTSATCGTAYMAVEFLGQVASTGAWVSLASTANFGSWDSASSQCRFGNSANILSTNYLSLTQIYHAFQVDSMAYQTGTGAGYKKVTSVVWREVI